MFLDKGTPEHKLVNKYSAEHVRFKHLLKECQKSKPTCTGCEVNALEGSLETIKEIIQQYIKEKHNEETSVNSNYSAVHSFCSMG